MPNLETIDKITPRSVLRHRPIEGDTAKPAARTAVTTSTTPIVQRASRPAPQTTENHDEVVEWQRAEGEDENKVAVKRPRTPTRQIPGTSGSPSKIPGTKGTRTRRHLLRNLLGQGHPLL